MLIVLEGLDGAGKSTQINYLRNYFESKGKEVKYLHFPRFDSPVYGGMIARFLRGDFGQIDQVHPMMVALLYAGDRGDASSLIKSWLDQDYVVLLDRYIYSNIAFQCAKIEDSVAREEIRSWIFETEYSYFSIPVPDLSLFLDVPLRFVGEKLSENREGSERDYLMGKRDIHEADILFQERVRDIYLDECERGEGLVKVNCSSEDGSIAAPEIISARIMNKIEEIL